MAIGAVLLLALGLAVAPQAPAGVIHGRVTDATSLPLPGVTVAVKGGDRFAVTDERGEFDLSAPAGSRLLLSLPGFTPREIVAPPSGTLAITLQVANVSAAVTVRAPNPAPPVESRFALSPLDVVRTPGAQADLMRALEAMPGVATIDEGAGLYVRGGDVSEVLVLLDGVVVSHPYRYETPTGGFRGAVDPFLTQGASFTTGGFSAQYGNVMSGVIDLAGLGRPKSARITATAGLAGVSLSGARPIGASGGVRVAANRTTPAILFAVNDSPREYDRLPGGWDVSGGAYYDSPSLGSFRVMAIAQRDHVGVELERDAFAGFLHSGTRHELIAARWERGLAGAWRATASLGSDIYANHTDAGVLRLDTSDRHHSGRVEIAGSVLGWRLRTGGDADLARGAVTGAVPRTGGDLGGVAGVSRFSAQAGDRHGGLYADVSRGFGRFTPELGTRVDYFDRGQEWSADPRAGLRVDLASRQHLRFAWGVYHQTPGAKYFDSVRGASALRAMAATHYVAGYERGSLGERTFVRIEAYAKRYRHLPLESDATGFTSDGYGSAQGLDLFARRIWPRLTIRGSASLLRAERRWTAADQQDRYPLPPGTWSPDFAIPFSWQIVASAPLVRGWSTGATWRTAAGRPFTPALGGTATPSGYRPIWAAINSGRLPRYERLDLSVAWMRPVGRQTVTVFASLDNALGRRNFFEYAYSADYSERRPVSSTSPRSVYIGCSVIK
jgi:hypothetical protein